MTKKLNMIKKKTDQLYINVETGDTVKYDFMTLEEIFAGHDMLQDICFDRELLIIQPQLNLKQLTVFVCQ